MSVQSLNKVSLVAPCGMNCSICSAHLRGKNKCVGCRGSNFNKPVTRVSCKLKTCEVFQKERAKYCFECKSFPCENLRHLDKRYRTKYNMSMIANLEYIKDFGIRKFVRNEDLRWTCAQCAGTICVHTGFCIDCGKSRPRMSGQVSSPSPGS
ncbi:MAG: DUF3795 domain-containing protein [Bacteroidota bacterium]